jgi:1,3-beta-glucanosyltransferase GAS1
VSVDGSSVSTLVDFGHLSTQIAKVSATGVNSNDYNPTNTAQRSCPAATSGWEASTALPPTPNEQLCSCMVKNLTCNAKADIDPKAFGALFNASCPASGACNGIFSNGATGQYGAYSMCNSAEQLAWAFNNYYFNNPGSSDACDFSGNATKQNPQLANGCSSLLSQAGAAGTGQVTSQPSGTGAIGGSSSSSSAAVALTVPPIDMRVVGVGIYVTVAAIAGAGIIFL